MEGTMSEAATAELTADQAAAFAFMENDLVREVADELGDVLLEVHEQAVLVSELYDQLSGEPTRENATRYIDAIERQMQAEQAALPAKAKLLGALRASLEVFGTDPVPTT
jgi:polyhydroxyalkanoate synthesis regulator phasin